MLVRILAAFAGISVGASATTIVALWSPERLLLAADSNVITNVPNVLGTACKISEDGSIAYAFSGFVTDKNAGYDAAKLAHQAMQGSGDLAARLVQFLAITRDPLARAVAGLKQDSPDQYQYLLDNHPVLQAIFADIEPGPPLLGVAGFSLAPDGSFVDFSRIAASGDDGLGTRIIYAGQQTQIKEYLNEHRDWPFADRTALVRTLIQSEIDASHGEVGGPIDILAIEPNAVHWIQKKPECN